MKEVRQKRKKEKRPFGLVIGIVIRIQSNEFDGSDIKESKRKGDMAKSVDATDLIGLSLSMETY